jgi:DNA-binding transcriptional MerR regulator
MAEEMKAVVSVSEMATMVGLSRARFYQLQKEGVFPPPERDKETGKPFYTLKVQKICLEVRRRNFGVNGKKILFYAARRPMLKPARPRPKRARAQKDTEHRELVEGLQALGLSNATSAQVDAALKEAFPQGTAGVTEAEIIRGLFLHLKCRNSGDNVGR